MNHVISKSDKPTAYLIDASIYIFRAWFSIPDSMRGDNGSPVNAVYGFSRFLTEFVERSQASYIGIAFDESLTTSFRNDLYPQYKMNRELAPEELSQQFNLCRRTAEAAGFYDDFWWDFARNQQLDAAAVVNEFGVPPQAIQDYLGLCGDAVDNIPGVPGVGPKTASALLNEFESMEAIYQNLDSISGLPIRGAKTLAKKLVEHQEQAELSKLLATVAYDAPIKMGADDLLRKAAEISSLQEISQIIGGRGDGLFQRLVNSSKLQRK